MGLARLNSSIMNTKDGKMRNSITRLLGFIVAACIFLLAGCAGNAPSPNPTPAPPNAAAPSPATASPTVANSTAQGVTFTASPNPIQVCDGSGLGTTTLTWKAPKVKVG